MTKAYLLLIGLFLLVSQIQTQTVMDVDGNVYNTVVIGTQLWMKENLRTTKLNDSTAIPLVTDKTSWNNQNSYAYCWYDNNDTLYKDTYGALYNWYAVNTEKLCPTGWHIPTGDEWITLYDYLGGYSVAGGKMKDDTTLWKYPNTGATNSSGFSALPGGSRTVGVFMYLGYDAYFWSATANIDANKSGLNLLYDEQYIANFGNPYNEIGISVRCLTYDIPSQIKGNSINDYVQIYPNPTDGKIKITVFELFNNNYIIEVYNSLGRRLLVYNVVKGTSNISIDLSEFPSGMYLLKLVTKEGIYDSKIIKR
jgi:uncharacterized protein (TIGR02145 family)